jgi:hypothetical protein
MRSASAAVALVEEDGEVGVRVEERAKPRRAPGPWAAVKDHGRLALRVAAQLPMDEVAVADVQQAALERLGFWVRRHRSYSP